MTCRASHSAVGCRVTSNRRRPWPSTRKANKRSNVTVGTTYIDGCDRVGVVAKKGLPRLRWRPMTAFHVLGDCGLGDIETEHQELAMDPRCTPQRVFPAHPQDDITQVTIDLRSPCPFLRFPAPESLEASTMPPQDRLLLHHPRQIEQVGANPSHPDQQGPVATVQSKPNRCPPQGDIELMARKQFLDLKPAPRLEQIANEYSERAGWQASH